MARYINADAFDEEYKHEYTLDEIGNVRIMRSKVLFEIPCEW